MDTNQPQKVTVLTAGGIGGSKKKQSSKEKQKPEEASSSSSAATTTTPTPQFAIPQQRETQNKTPTARLDSSALEYEEPSQSDSYADNEQQQPQGVNSTASRDLLQQPHGRYSDLPGEPGKGDPLQPIAELPSTTSTASSAKSHEVVWLFICFLGIMASFVCYGLLLEYATSGGRKLHELSFLFVTSGLYTLTAAAGCYVRDETPTTIPPARFAILGLTSMGSTFFSVRSLRYVIYPIQVLAKSCKPVPVMLMGALMGKSYPLRKYMNVVMIVGGVALFMGGGDNKKKAEGDDGGSDEESSAASASQIIGIIMLFISLCFDGGTGAYEDKLMSVHSVQPFDLMYNIQLGKTILAGIGLLVLNEVHVFVKLVADMGFLLLALGLSGALGQVFIFVTIAKFGALTCSIIGLARKVTTLCASIYFYGHQLNAIQGTGLLISVTAMVMNFWGKKKGGGGHGGGGGHEPERKNEGISPEEMQKMLGEEEDEEQGDLEMEELTAKKP